MDTKFVEIQKQIEAKKEGEKTKTLKETVKDQVEFKKDMAKFYAVNPAATKHVELDQFVG